MKVLRQEQASRRLIVRQAVTNLQARGSTLRPAVLALYERYVQGGWSRAQVTAEMHQRAIDLYQAVSSARSLECASNPIAAQRLEVVG